MSQLSPLQLEHSVFTEFHLELVPTDADIPLRLGYPIFSEAVFSTESSFERIAPEDVPEGAPVLPHYGVQLTVVFAPKDEEKPLFPYRARVAMSGIFTTTLPEETREALVLVNGSSLLFSAIREHLLTMTSRFGGPSLMLPTVQFAKLAQQMQEKQKTIAQAPQANEPTHPSGE